MFFVELQILWVNWTDIKCWDYELYISELIWLLILLCLSLAASNVLYMIYRCVTYDCICFVFWVFLFSVLHCFVFWMHFYGIYHQCTLQNFNPVYFIMIQQSYTEGTPLWMLLILIGKVMSQCKNIICL